MTTPAKCATCRFWRGYVTNGNVGWCRVRSPRLFLSPVGEQITGWPETSDYEWCGEHAPREET